MIAQRIGVQARRSLIAACAGCRAPGPQRFQHPDMDVVK